MTEQDSGSPSEGPARLESAAGATGWELLTLAIDAAGVGTFDWDLITGTLNWDARLIELFGYGTHEFDRSIAGFNARLHPDDLGRVAELIESAIQAVGEFLAEYRVVLPGGQVRWITARGRALADESGTAVRLLGAAWDVSGRQQAQERLAQLIEEMAVGFIAMDTDWVMTHVNAEAERITATPRAQLLGRTQWQAFPAAVGTEFEANYRRAAVTGESVVFEAFYPEPLNIWVEVRALPSPEGMAVYFLDLTARRRAQELAERTAVRERLLSEVAEAMSATLDADEAASRLAELVVPALADWCIVTLVDDGQAAGSSRGLRAAASWHAEAALRDTVAGYAQLRLGALEEDSIIIRAMRSGQVQVLDAGASERVRQMITPGPVRELVDTLSPEAVAVLPLPGRAGPVGLLTLANGATRGAFTTENMTTAQHVAFRAGLGMDNARLYRQQRSLAEGFQRSLLTPPPQPDHLQIVVRYVPAAQAAEVGGDWYDAFLQPAGATVLVIGDVVGHDVAAAAAMGQARTIVRTVAARDHQGPAAVLTEVEQVMQTLQSNIVATAVVARLEQTDAQRQAGVTRLRWSNAGHPPPMLLTPDGQVKVLDGGRPDLLLGVRPDTPRTETERMLDRGSVLLLYTDGLVESRHQDIDHGIHRLQAVLGELAGRDVDELCDEVLARMLPTNPGDDVALVAVHLHSEDRPRPAEAGPTRVPPNVPG